jgi:two-component system, OmpR family, response regulator
VQRLPSGGTTALVVDADQETRALLAELLPRAGLSVIEAPDGETALALAETTRPALVVLEVCLPGLGGYEVCRELRQQFGQEMAIVFLSADRIAPTDRTAGLLIGADDYVAKPFLPDELLARVRRLLIRRPAPNAPDETFSELTTRELEILELLASGLTQADIAHELVLSPKTVGTHIQHILGKLDIHSRAQAVALAHQHGLIAT